MKLTPPKAMDPQNVDLKQTINLPKNAFPSPDSRLARGTPSLRWASELRSKKAQMSTVEIRRACRAYAEKYVDLQRTDFKRLGVLGRWEDPYLTMSASYQSVIAFAPMSCWVPSMTPGHESVAA